MSFLSEAQRDELAARFNQVEQVEDNSENVETTQEVVETTNESVDTAPPEETDNAEQNDVKVAEDTSTSEEDEKNIPYSRFKSVIESRNQFKSQVSDLESQLEELRKELATTNSNPTEEGDDLFGYLDDDEPDERYTDLEKRLERFEVAQAEVDLQREITATRQAFPSVPEEVLLNAVIQNAEADLMDVAHRYDTFVESIKKEALVGYVPAKTAEAPPTAPRRVKSAGAAGSTFDAVANKPKTMDDAKASFMDYLKQNWK